MPGSSKQGRSKSNASSSGSKKPVLSAWLVRTLRDQESIHLPSLSSRHLSFPCRICIAIGKPITPTTADGQNLSTASCALDIGGKLYVITSSCNVTASSVDGTRNGKVWNDFKNDERIDHILESVRLGRVVYEAGGGHFAVIEVADTFRACRAQNCLECSIPLNDKWLESRIRFSALSGDVKVPILYDPRENALNPLTGYHVDLRYTAMNQDEASFEEYNIHEGSPTWENGFPASIDDSGSLVVCDGQIIGISTFHTCGYLHDGYIEGAYASVLLLDTKLWAFFMRRSDIFKHLKGRKGPLTVSRAWQHLEYRP
ncbi:hypothetical protein F5Y09DRAFT_350711 [Xylaria sp. FL1042]|nr:hypothetical protein F5Y09DRAFT_350711 [Xylaria sp. FL1042]